MYEGGVAPETGVLDDAAPEDMAPVKAVALHPV